MKPAVRSAILEAIDAQEANHALLEACVEYIATLEATIEALRMDITRFATERNTLASAIRIVGTGNK